MKSRIGQRIQESSRKDAKAQSSKSKKRSVECEKTSLFLLLLALACFASLRLCESFLNPSRAFSRGVSRPPFVYNRALPIHPPWPKDPCHAAQHTASRRHPARTYRDS